jgi:hypothetical protein
MRRLLTVLHWAWELFGAIVLLAMGWHFGGQAGYGRGARDLARLVIEMRQGAYETPAPWQHGSI